MDNVGRMESLQRPQGLVDKVLSQPTNPSTVRQQGDEKRAREGTRTWAWSSERSCVRITRCMSVSINSCTTVLPTFADISFQL